MDISYGCEKNVRPGCDMVNHPSHYETGKYQCIEVMEEVFGEAAVCDFCLLNAFKYLYQCKNKHFDPIEDIKKARWYLDKYISLRNR